MSSHEMPSRRLLWIHQNFVTGRQAGNSRAVAQLAALLEANWQVDVVCSQVSYLGAPTERRGRKPLVQQDGALTIHRLPASSVSADPSRRGLAYLEFIARSLAYTSALPRPDLVVCSLPPSPQGLASLTHGWRTGAPILLELRDLWPALLVEGGLVTWPPAVLALEWLEGLACGLADRVVVAVPAFLPYAQRMGLEEEAVAVIPTGATGSWLDVEPGRSRNWRQEHGLEDRFIALYAGSFNTLYAMDRLIAAARLSQTRSPHVAWVIAGAGRQLPIVEKAARELDNVYYLGALPRDELGPTLLAADVGLLAGESRPLIRLALPGKVYEYLAAGLPALAFNPGHAGSLLERIGAGRYVGGTDAEFVSHAVHEFAGLSPEARQEMGATGQKWVLDHLSAAGSARQFADVALTTVQRGRHTNRKRRLLRAAASATRTVLERRSARAVEELFVLDDGAAAQVALNAWFEGLQPSPRKRLSVPHLLWRD